MSTNRPTPLWLFCCRIWISYIKLSGDGAGSENSNNWNIWTSLFPILPQKTDYSLMMVQRGIDRVRQGRPHWVLMIQSLWCNHFRFTWDQFGLLPPWVPVTHPHENTHMCLYTQRIAAIYQSVLINELELFKHTNTLRMMFSDSEWFSYPYIYI